MLLADRVLLRSVLVAAVAFAAGRTSQPPDLHRACICSTRCRTTRQILKDQWSVAHPDRSRRQRAGDNYGLLVDNGRAAPITLEESIALALENNTGLRINKLNPIAARRA